jgi:hypothetical protein
VFKPNLQAVRTRSQSRSADQQAQVNDAEPSQIIPDRDNIEDRDEGQTIIFGGIVTENGAKNPPHPPAVDNTNPLPRPTNKIHASSLPPMAEPGAWHPGVSLIPFLPDGLDYGRNEETWAAVAAAIDGNMWLTAPDHIEFTKALKSKLDSVLPQKLKSLHKESMANEIHPLICKRLGINPSPINTKQHRFAELVEQLGDDAASAASLRAYLKRGYEGQQDKFEFMIEHIVKLSTRVAELEGALAKNNKTTKQMQEKQSKMHTKQKMIIRRVKESEANALSASWAAKDVLMKQDQMCQHTNIVAKQIAEIKQIAKTKRTAPKRQTAKGKGRKVAKPTPVKRGKRTNKPERVPDPTAKKIVIRGVKPDMNNDAVAATINAQMKLKAVVKNLAFIRYPNTRRPVVAEFTTLEALHEFMKNKSKLAEGWLFDEWKERPGRGTGRPEAAQPRAPTAASSRRAAPSGGSASEASAASATQA